MTWGVLRHTVLLPSVAENWTEERRRLVLAHELAHVKRRDGVTQILVQLVSAAYWFHPLVWYAAHRIRVEREHACDDHVLRLGAAAPDYAEHLVQITRCIRSDRSLSFAAVSMAQPSELETRVVSILDSGVRRRAVSKTSAIMLMTFTLLLTVSLAAIAIAAAVTPPPVFVAAALPAAMERPAPAPQRTRIGNAATPATTVRPPIVLESKPPIYTTEAEASRIEGVVTLEASVDAKGEIRILRIVKALGYGLDQRAIGAVLDWKFAPATRNGVPVTAVTQIDVDFRLPPRTHDAAGVFNEVESIVTLSKAFATPEITPPILIHRVEPKYSPEALQKKYQGTVLLRATVHKDGSVTVDEVVRKLGLGLDESAVQALEQWKFRAGARNGEPISVQTQIAVHFNLK
jgi:TonB family protein